MYERYYSTCQEMCRGLGTVRECRGGEGQGRERESETEIRRKRGGGGGKNKGSEAKRDTEKGEWGRRKWREKEGGLGRAEEARSFLTRGDGSTVNHSLIPSSLCTLPHSLHMNRGYVILIKRSRVTVEPSIWMWCREARGAWNTPHNTNLSSPLPHTWLATFGSSV